MNRRTSLLRESVCDLAAEFLPKGLAVLDRSTGEWPLAAMIESVPVDFGETVELVAFLGSTEFADDLAATLADFRGPATAILCAPYLVGTPGDLPILETGWRRAYTFEAFSAEVERAGYQVVVCVFTAQGPAAACLLLPRADDEDAWWHRSPAAETIEVYGYRSERQIAKHLLATEAGLYGGDWRLQSEQLRSRVRVAAALIPPGLTILDVGCGAMYLESEAAPARYIPVDLVARDDRTRIVDLALDDLPRAWVEEADVVALLNLFEHFDDPARVLLSVAACGKTVITSSKVIGTPSLDSADIEQMFADTGFTVTDKALFGDKLILWRLDCLTEAGDLRLPPAPGREHGAPMDFDPAEAKKAANRKAKQERLAAREARAARLRNRDD
ncbi:methyltransferase domain-containing protein [Zavarzinia aquatilis]|nr:hypothetical protein [Zavarzinia aquatilis]